MEVKERLAALRRKMAEQSIDAYVVPSGDPHNGEYPADHWQCREWITGFKGSAGTAVVTRDRAGLWTDSRYHLAAERMLEGSTVELFRAGLPEVPTFEAWLADVMEVGQVVGLCGETSTYQPIQRMERTLRSSGLKLRTDLDLVSELWKDRPPIPADPVFLHDVKYAGKSRSDKVSEFRKSIKKKKADVALLTDLADVAWLLNVRGTDVSERTTTISFALIDADKVTWFIDPAKVPDEVREELVGDGIELRPYGECRRALEGIDKGAGILLDPSGVNQSLFEACRHLRIVETPSVVAEMKAIKNETEIGHFRECLRRDGVALARFFAWLDRTLGQERVTELSASVKLNGFRAEQDLFRHDSFPAIMGYQGHGAMGHYRVTKESDVEIRREGLLLVDSGGAYLDGTTDTTRVVALGKPTDQQKTDFTLVLKGVIELTTTVFPSGTSGIQLDVLARRSMWNHGRTFGHGTGHGVGFFLDVHEGPQRFSAKGPSADLKPGMVTTIEPGIYRPDEYGIRIENMVLCEKHEKTKFAEFLKFDTLTLFPISPGLVDRSLLTDEEAAWLNGYHRTTYEKLSPSLDEGEREWLKRETDPV